MTEAASLDNACTDRTCSTCGYSGPVGDFYDTSAECRDCKRSRSRLNRVVTAQKVALADRLLDIVERLAERGAIPATNQGPAGDCSTARPLSESQEIRL